MMNAVCKRNRRRYRVEYLRKPLSDRAKKVLKICGYVFLALIILSLILIFVVFPLIFMKSIELQRMIMFTNMGLPEKPEYFQMYEYVIPGLRNMNVTVQGDSNHTGLISLGLWHLLPHNVTYTAILEQDFDFDEALRNSNHSVLLFFHGNGQTRSDSVERFHILRIFFHVIAFDYRSYADSTNALLTEEGIVSDSIQLYQWLSNKTTAPIFIWGHSLGSSLATRTMSHLIKKNPKPIGLILEGAFTSMREELPVHPYGKIFAWLPWFEATVLNPLEKNGFIFNTSKYIREVDVPVMILSAEDDSTVPYYFGRQLFDIVSTKLESLASYYQFFSLLGHNHFWIYEDSQIPSFIKDFIQVCFDYSNATNLNID